MGCERIPILVLPRLFEYAAQQSDQIFSIEGARHTADILRDQVLSWFFEMGISRRLASPDPIRFSQGVRKFRDLIDQNPRRLRALLPHLILDPVLTDPAYIKGAVEVVTSWRPHSVGNFFPLSGQAAALVFPDRKVQEILHHVSVLNELRITGGLIQMLKGDHRECLLQWSLLAAEFSGIPDPKTFQEDVTTLAQIYSERGEHQVALFLEARLVAIMSPHLSSMESVVQKWEDIVLRLQDFVTHLGHSDADYASLVTGFRSIQNEIKAALESLREDPRFLPFYRKYVVLVTTQSQQEQEVVAKIVEDLRDQVGFLMDFCCDVVSIPDGETYFCERERQVRLHQERLCREKTESMLQTLSERDPLRRFDHCCRQVQSLYQQASLFFKDLSHHVAQVNRTFRDGSALWKVGGSLRETLIADPILLKKYNSVISDLHSARFNDLTHTLNTSGKKYSSVLREVVFQEVVRIRDESHEHPYFKYSGVMKELLRFMRLFSAENETRLDYQIFTAELALIMGYREEAEERLKPALKKVPDSLFLKNILRVKSQTGQP